jgi:uncharacterized protein (TIGR00730 family)
MTKDKIIAVFGSSRAKPDSNTYNQALEIGKLLVEAGFMVCNGGYAGIMEASAKGAKQANGKTIGVTGAFEKLKINEWIDEEIHSQDYMERLQKLVQIADAFIILKGGIGTLSEFSIAWCLNAIGEIRKPMILVGDSWKNIVDNMSKNLVISPQEMDALIIVKEPKSAVEILKRMF